ncbi:MAG: hypothetical protein IKV14_04700 [Muribaculaceae bacterium]|nr:hypothetical protein [Muribaculaceae bacterium]
MKQTLKKLLCGMLLLAMPMAMFAKKSKNDTIYRPLYTAFELNIGGAAWVEKPLSYFTFNGTNLSLSLEMMRACRGESKWVQQHQLRYIYSTGDMAISGNGGSKVQLVNYTFGMMTYSTLAPKFRLYYGTDLNILGGMITNLHGGNNPKTLKGDISVGFTGMAVYDFKLGKVPVTTRYQMSLPVLSAFIQQKQGYFATGLGDGWTGGSWGRHFNMRNRLHFDLHFSSWALRLGYNNDILTNYATPNRFQYVSHNFVLGFAGELMRWSQKNANKKIKTALYTY